MPIGIEVPVLKDEEIGLFKWISAGFVSVSALLVLFTACFKN